MKQIESKELAVVKTQITKAVAAAQELTIKTEEDAKGATDLLSKIKLVGKLIAEKKEAITKPLMEAIKETRALFAPLEASYTEAERTIKGKMIDYSDMVEEANRKKAEKIESKVEDGKMSFEKGSEKIAALPDAQAKVEGNKGQVTFRIQKDIKVVDKSKIPLEYMEPDLVAIRRAVLAGQEVPGIKVVERKGVAAR